MEHGNIWWMALFSLNDVLYVLVSIVISWSAFFLTELAKLEIIVLNVNSLKIGKDEEQQN